MPYLSYLTENCKSSARTYGLLEATTNLASKIEKDQSIQQWDKFLPTPYIKKDLGKSYRVVCSQQTLNDDIVVISFLECFARGGDGVYEKNFLKDPNAVCGRLVPSVQALETFVSARTATIPVALPELNDVESHYLYDSLPPAEDDDIVIYETTEWVERMSSQRVFEMSSRFYDSLTSLVHDHEKENNHIKQDDKSGTTIVYKYVPSSKSLILIAPLIRQDSNQAAAIVEKNKSYIQSDKLSEELILKIGRRSYPSFILADEGMWKNIQKNDVGNIALSPEESRILEGISRKGDDKLFPLFINGRPGSGKSTILQYLFAEHLCMHLRNDESLRLKMPPLYLTYSEQLLNLAKKTIDAILKCNVKIAMYDIDISSASNKLVIENSFGVFHKFLLSLLDPQSRAKFPIEKKRDFTQFRKLWDERRKMIPQQEVRMLSPELAWHVLRSYIKGMRYDIEHEFDTASYAELPDNEKTVQEETFQKIYDHVWDGWYKKYCQDEGYWDDQDLVFSVLNQKNLDISLYPAVFCDEAQDFSKLELDLILRLSIFSQRSVAPQSLKFVPFAFAGDPFQTLNPTGFDWGSLQANFHEKIVQGLDRTSRGKLKFNYQELSYNYRSGKYVVGICNLIQLLRGILFGQKDLKPQVTWFDSDSSMPVYFNVSDPVCEQKLREQSEMVIILPCQEGEEEEYVQGDAFLRRLITTEADIRNFLSPMRAKGLEFSRVVLYKFGSACHNQYPDLLKPLETGEPHKGNKDATLPLEYYLNRLYVGASRAKNRLIIVDDQDGINTLWNRDELKSLESLLNVYVAETNNDWQLDSVNYIQSGTAENWSQDRDDPIRLGKDMRESGLAEKDPYKLRLAESNYLRAKQFSNAKQCKADRLLIEEDYSAAAAVYLELDQKDTALQCYWKADNYQAILNTSSFANTIEQRAADYMCSTKSESDVQRLLALLNEECETERKWKIVNDSGWAKILGNLVTSIFKMPNADLKSIFVKLKKLQLNGFSIDDKINFAQIAFMAGEYQEALTIWDALGAYNSQEKNYIIARAHTAKYPSNIQWFNRTGDLDAICREWTDNKSVPLSGEDADIISQSLIEKNEFASALEILATHPNEDRLKKCYLKFRKTNNLELVQQAGQQLIYSYIQHEKWNEAVNIIEDRDISQDMRNLFSSTFTLRSVVADSIKRASIEGKNIIGGVLKRHYIGKPWVNILPINIVGAAIEHANKITDSLEFYENIWKYDKIPATIEEVDFAVRRWVKCKLRYAEYVLKEKNNQAEAGRHRAEAETVCSAKLRINKDNIEEYPIINVNESEIKRILGTMRVQKLTEKTKNAIITLYSNGTEIQDIAEVLKIDLATVETIIKESNVQKS